MENYGNKKVGQASIPERLTSPEDPFVFSRVESILNLIAQLEIKISPILFPEGGAEGAQTPTESYVLEHLGFIANRLNTLINRVNI